MGPKKALGYGAQPEGSGEQGFKPLPGSREEIKISTCVALSEAFAPRCVEGWDRGNPIAHQVHCGQMNCAPRTN